MMEQDRRYRILIYGVGVIGSLYAVYLEQSGCDVAVLARGYRLKELRKKGLLYQKGSKCIKANITVLDELEPRDRYDYVFLTVRAEQLHAALAALKDNISPTVVTMVNSIEDHSKWEAICGKGRILPAFPGAGGSIRDGILYAIAMIVGIAELISERFQKLDRILPKKRLYRGFGALTWGDFGGVIVGLTALFTALRAGYSVHDCRLLLLLAVGGVLCALFAGLIFKTFRTQEE